MVRYRVGHETLTILRGGKSVHGHKIEARAVYHVWQLAAGWAVEECQTDSKGAPVTRPITMAVFATESDADWLARALAGHVALEAMHHRADYPAPRGKTKGKSRGSHPVTKHEKDRHSRFIMGGKRRAI